MNRSFIETNTAMVDAIAVLLPALREHLAAKEFAGGRAWLQSAEEQVERLLASREGGV